VERNYEFRKKLLEVHQSGRRDMELIPCPDEHILTSETNILIPADAGRVLLRAARDMQDYLFISMGLSVRLMVVESILDALYSGKGNIVYTTKDRTNTDLLEGDTPCGYRIDCGDNIVITGYDEAGAMQGGFYIEDVMNLRRAPFLPLATVTKHPLFSPRMIQSGFGLCLYPDQHIAAIAHAGINAILIYVKGMDMTPFGHLDFNDLCWRAAEYGVGVYAYSDLKNNLHPSDPDATAYYDKIYGSVFQHCPAFKGIILVGESVEFPSRDKRTTGKAYQVHTADGLPADKPSPGYWPCHDFPVWLELVRDTVRQYNPEADIVFWTYNWGYVEEKYRLELIQRLPTDISLMVTFEMFESRKAESVTISCVDYTLMFEGPGKYFLSEAKAAHERGIRLYAMTNTGGLTWDVGVIPYEPAPQQWIRRHRAILNMREQYGLCGLMESHHYGFWPSFVAELAKWAFTSGSPEPERVLELLAIRDFREGNAQCVMEAWELWSEGIQHYISTDEDQYGPFRIGPSYPLVLCRDVKIPESPFAPVGNAICKTNYSNADLGRFSLFSFRLPVEIEHIEAMEKCFMDGAVLLEEMLDTLKGTLKDQAERMVNLGWFISRCARTAIHVKKWYQYKLKLLSASENEEVLSIVKAMTIIARDEIANAKATIPLVQRDSRLGWEPTMEYMCDEAHLRWKIRQVELMMKNELSIYETSLQFNGS